MPPGNLLIRLQVAVLTGTALALLAAVLLGTSPIRVLAVGACGQPLSVGSQPNASDALFTLHVAIKLTTCPLSVCDVDASCAVTVGDALRILRKAVGMPVILDCDGRCAVTTTLRSIPTTSSSSTSSSLGTTTTSFTTTSSTTTTLAAPGSHARLGPLEQPDNVPQRLAAGLQSCVTVHPGHGRRRKVPLRHAPATSRSWPPPRTCPVTEPTSGRNGREPRAAS